MQLWTPEPIDTRVSVSTQTRLDTDEACAARSRQGSVKWRSHLTGAVCVRHYLFLSYSAAQSKRWNLWANGSFGKKRGRHDNERTETFRTSTLERPRESFRSPTPPTPQGPLFDFVCWLA